mgnify:CR=1 FL=1
MHQTPLRSFHAEYGGQMVEFAGWEMPLRYPAGVLAEHHQVRTSGGIFDVSHMGRVEFKGRHARRLLERCCTRRIHDMQEGQARYSLVCNEQGGVKDDVLVYRMDDDRFLVVVNASNREKLLKHFEDVRVAGELSCSIDDQTMKTAMVAIQGPKVMDLISRVSSEVPNLKRYRFTVKNLMIVKLIVSRTGYTGEDGVEVILPSGAIGMALKLLMKDIDMNAEQALVKPAGLAARDTLRTEAGMPLYGHELGEDINALSCGVNFAINMDKDADERGEAFIGLDALRRTEQQGGPARVLVGLRLEGKRSARQGHTVYDGDRAVGEVTSGCVSPTLGYPIAMAFVDRGTSEPGRALSVDIGRVRLEGQTVPMPFYKAPKPS